jgi:hypothetical protein
MTRHRCRRPFGDQGAAFAQQARALARRFEGQGNIEGDEISQRDGRRPHDLARQHPADIAAISGIGRAAKLPRDRNLTQGMLLIDGHFAGG